jgi:hypothetical protein
VQKSIIFLVCLPWLASASEIDCSNCSFGTQIQTLTSTYVLCPTCFEYVGDGITLTGTTVTTVYQSGPVFTYLYAETETANIPVEIPSIMVIGRVPFDGLLGWGVDLALTTSGVTECPSSQINCWSGSGWGSGYIIGSGFIQNYLGFQFGSSFVGTGLATDPAIASNDLSTSFAFYVQSYGAPQSQEGRMGGAFYFPTVNLGPGEAVQTFALVPGPTAPEPGAFWLLGVGLLCLIRLKGVQRLITPRDLMPR